MYLTFVEKLDLVVQTTNVGTQKIDGTTLETYKIMVAAFSITDQANRVRFFEEIFLVANVSSNIVFGMLFFTPSSADIDFPKKELWWRFYTIEEALSTTKQVELVRKKEFAAVAFDLRYETFVVYVTFLKNPS